MKKILFLLALATIVCSAGCFAQAATDNKTVAYKASKQPTTVQATQTDVYADKIQCILTENRNRNLTPQERRQVAAYVDSLTAATPPKTNVGLKNRRP